QRIDERRFPGAGAGRRPDDHGIGGLEDGLDALEDPFGDLREFGPAMIDDRSINRAQNAIRNGRRSRNLQEMTAWVARGILGHVVGRPFAFRVAGMNNPTSRKNAIISQVRSTAYKWAAPHIDA